MEDEVVGEAGTDGDGDGDGDGDCVVFLKKREESSESSGLLSKVFDVFPHCDAISLPPHTPK